MNNFIGVIQRGLLNDLFSNNTSELKIGDRVRVKNRGQEGYIIDKNGNLYMVSINNGQIIDSYEANDLEKCWQDNKVIYKRKQSNNVISFTELFCFFDNQ